jgi:hypothetical protein
MTNWKQKIVDAFISHYFASVRPSSQNEKVAANVLRVRSSLFFPDFDSSHPDEKESYLEAAEYLERKGLIKLNWEKRNKGERLKTLNCTDFKKIFEEAHRLYPETEAQTIRAMLEAKAKALKDSSAAQDNVIHFLEFFSVHFSPREIGLGIDQRAMVDFIRLLEFSQDLSQQEKITIRALSILLYCDSKRLEDVLVLCKPLLLQAQKNSSLNMVIPERSYPETMISGNISIEFKNNEVPMINAGGHILNLPLETAEAICAIRPLAATDKKMVLTIENKETFYALGSPNKTDNNLSRFNCFLYVGGYSNRATAALIQVLAACGFSFYHAGDLDPDGILILQHISDIAEKPVIPLRMDIATFNQYMSWGRTLTKTMLRQIEKIREETKAIPELSSLLQRIEETGLGIEQEIIDYR